MLSIGEFSKIGLVTTKALRYYDEIGLLKPEFVQEDSGYRYYGEGQLKQLLLINRLKVYGCSLKEISAVLSAPEGGSLLLSLLQEKGHLLGKKLQNDRLVLEQLEQDTEKLKRGMNIMATKDYSVKLVEMEPMNILSIREKINVDAYGMYIGRLYERISAQGLTPLGAPMSIFHDEEYDPKNYDMEIAIPVKEQAEGTREYAPGKCAQSTLNGPYSGLTEVYAHMREWIMREGYELSSPPFEIYLSDPFKIKPDDLVTEVYFPVK